MLATPDLSLVYIMILFGISVFVVRTLIFRPIIEVMDARAHDVTSAEALHAAALEESKKAIAAAEERLSAARRAAVAERYALRTEGQAERQKKIDAARGEAEKLVKGERAALEAQLPSLKESLRQEAQTLAAEVTTRLLGRAA